MKQQQTKFQDIKADYQNEPRLTWKNITVFGMWSSLFGRFWFENPRDAKIKYKKNRRSILWDHMIQLIY